MDDDSMEHPGSGWNGNWRAPLMAAAILLAAAIYFFVRAIGFAYEGVIGLIGG